MTGLPAILLVTLICLFAGLDCKREPPIVPPTPPPPSHPTVTWIADTIHNPYPDSQLTLTSIWGSDTNDVYALGHNSEGGSASLYHYDGTKWSVVKITQAEGGFIGSYIDLLNIDGSGKNDVWAVGSRGTPFYLNADSSLVIHYDGSAWKEVQMERCKDAMQNLKVVGPNDVYFGGSFGEVYHYDGSTFTKTVLDTNVNIALGGDDIRMYAGGTTYYLTYNPYVAVYSKLGDGPWQLIKKTSEADYYQYRTYGYLDFYSLGGGRYFSGGEGIYVLSDSTWQLSYSADDYPYTRIRGTGPMNVFAISSFNRLLHWDGADWKLLNIPEGLGNNPVFGGGLWVKGNKIFISCLYGFDVNIIYRGTY